MRKIAVFVKTIKYPLLLAGVFLASLLIAYAVYMSDIKEIQIFKDGEITKVTTRGNTVQDALEDAGIEFSEDDILNCSLKDQLTDVSKITIETPRQITVNIRGEDVVLTTFSDTVAEALSEAGITLSGNDKIEGADLDSALSSGMNISINTFTENFYRESEVLEHKTKYVADDTMLKGKEKTLVKGSDGLRVVFYKELVENGQVVGTEVVSESYTAPVDTVISYGTIKNFTNAAGQTVAYTKVYTMVATAYSPTPENNYYGTSIFYSDGTGFQNREGGVAVDPSVIPLGTLLYVKGLNGMPDYGFAYACDVGKSIKGNRIDLFMESEQTCIWWGVKDVEVYVLYDQSLSGRYDVAKFFELRMGKLFVNK